MQKRVHDDIRQNNNAGVGAPCFATVLKTSLYGAANKQESVCESCSALKASSLQNLSAVGGFHTLSEAVLFLSLELLGLICSNHAFAPAFLNNDLV